MGVIAKAVRLIVITSLLPINARLIHLTNFINRRVTITEWSAVCQSKLSIKSLLILLQHLLARKKILMKNLKIKTLLLQYLLPSLAELHSELFWSPAQSSIDSLLKSATT